jgi:uncharacterized membrane protein YvlD (DUF360 family)
VVNIVVFLLAAWLVPNQQLMVTTLGAAVGAIVAAVASGALTLVLGEGKRD